MYIVACDEKKSNESLIFDDARYTFEFGLYIACPRLLIMKTVRVQGLVLLFSRNIESGRTLLYRSSLDSPQLFSSVAFPQLILLCCLSRKIPFFRRFVF